MILNWFRNRFLAPSRSKGSRPHGARNPLFGLTSKVRRQIRVRPPGRQGRKTGDAPDGFCVFPAEPQLPDTPQYRHQTLRNPRAIVTTKQPDLEYVRIVSRAKVTDHLVALDAQLHIRRTVNSRRVTIGQ